MKPAPRNPQPETRNSKPENGFALVTAIFLLVVLASLGAIMMTFFSAQQQSSALDVMGARAYQAARAGLEWGEYQALRGGGACAANTALAAGTLGGTLNGFAVNVTCASSVHNDPGTATGTVTIYNLTSTASQGNAGLPDYVERQVSATIAQ
ncbi:MAG: hypothetical protein HY306_12380 [Nitrosomonadales bacterium]|nr:hypothetical protein [Nitrosomonadales bacterium]